MKRKIFFLIIGYLKKKKKKKIRPISHFFSFTPKINHEKQYK